MTDADVTSAYKQAVAMAKRYGYRVDDETFSTIGLAIAHATNKWTIAHKCKFATYAVTLAIRLLRRYNQRNKHEEELPEPEFVYHWYDRDFLQERLLIFSDYEQSLAFSVWIDGKSIPDAARELGISVLDAKFTLDIIACDLRQFYDDEPQAHSR